MTEKQSERVRSQSILDERRKVLIDKIKHIKTMKQQINLKDSLKNTTIKIEDKNEIKKEIPKISQNGNKQSIGENSEPQIKKYKPELKISDFTSIGLETLQNDYHKAVIKNKNGNHVKNNQEKKQVQPDLIKQENTQNFLKRPSKKLIFTEQLQNQLDQIQKQSQKKSKLVSPQKYNQSTCIEISSSQQGQIVAKPKISIIRKPEIQKQENQQVVKFQVGIQKQDENSYTESFNEMNELFSKIKLTYVHLSTELKAKLRRQKLKFDENASMQKNTDFKVNLQSTYVSIAQTAPISIIREKIKLKENIFTELKSYRFYVFKGSEKDLRQTIWSSILKDNIPIKSQRFINLQRLYQWYTLAHLLSCSSNIVIVVEKITPNSFVEDFYTFKCHCKNVCTEACLCLQFWVCRRKDPCSQRTLSMINRHQKICRYSKQFKPMSIREEYILLHQQGVVGLKNSQNSCFMNTALQCLVACQPLTQYFLENEYMKNLNLGNSFSTFGQITTRYVQFLREYFTTRKSVIDTEKFKRALCRWDNKYLDDQQQDSQQFLIQLLDWLKEDLNLNRTRPYYIETEDNQVQSVQSKAQKAWKIQLLRHNSIIEYLMAGVLKSEIQCTECSYKSQSFENFLTLPLPVTKSKPSQRWTFQIKVAIVYESFRKKNETTIIKLDSFRYKDALKQIKSTFGLKKQSSLIGIAYEPLTGQNRRIINEQQGRQQLIKSRRNPKQRSLLFYQHKKQQFDIQKFIEIKFSIKLRQNGELTNIGSQRYLFLSKKQKSQITLVYQKLLIYFYSMMFKRKNEMNEKEYLEKYLRPQNVPFKINISKENTQIPITSKVQLKHKTQIDVVFLNQDLFSCLELIKSIYVKKSNKLQQNFDNHQDPQMSIYDCFKEFESTDVMDLDNCWDCPKCMQKRKALKRISIYKAPKVLILFFKRFASTGEDYSHEMRKLQNFVSFPQALNLSGFVEKEELPYTSQKRPLKYKLFAVANHHSISSLTHGQSGHYIAYVCKKGEWYYVNDQSYGSIRAEDVCSQNAYMLFYMRQ